MRRILFILSFISILMSCQDDVNVFKVDLEPGNFSFTPISGGARMHYTLPKNSEIDAVVAVYNDDQDVERTIIGSYHANSMDLVGFVKDKDQVPVHVYYRNRDNELSEPIELSFNSQAVTAWGIFETLTIEPYWDGFQIKMDAPPVGDGFLHVGYKAVDEATGKEVVRLIETKLIEENNNLLLYTDDKLEIENEADLVIWSEDFHGNRVREVSQKVKFATTGLYDGPMPTLLNTENSLEDNDWYMTSWTKLFDGDKNGVQRLTAANAGEENAFHCWLSVEYQDNSEWIFDMGSEQVIAKLKMYQFLPMQAPVDEYFLNVDYWDITPCQVKVYGSNDQSEWTYLGEMDESPSTPYREQWCYRLFAIYDENLPDSHEYKKVFTDPEELEASDPNVGTIPLNFTNDAYRYVKFHVLNNYYTNPQLTDAPDDNVNEIIGLTELEFYVKQ